MQAHRCVIRGIAFLKQVQQRVGVVFRAEEPFIPAPFKKFRPPALHLRSYAIFSPQITQIATFAELMWRRGYKYLPQTTKWIGLSGVERTVQTG